MRGPEKSTECTQSGRGRGRGRRNARVATASLRASLLVCTLTLSSTIMACRGGSARDDSKDKAAFVQEHTDKYDIGLWPVMHGTPNVHFQSGYYPAEHDPEKIAGGAWRWQGKRGVALLRRGAIPNGDPVRLSIFGWTDIKNLEKLRLTSHLDFFINGVRISRFDTPKDAFEHVLTIPRDLLGNEDAVELVIVAANVTHPAGDWRRLGFATTGFLWREPTWQPPAAAIAPPGEQP